MTNQQHYTNNASTGLVRRDSVNGVPHIVVPTVAVIEGVLNGMYLSPEEIARSVPGWSGRPVTVYHPNNRLSAGTKEVIERQQIGFVMDPQYDVTDDGRARLLFDMWINVDEANRVHPGLVAELESEGSVVEVSTGYFAEVSDRRGYWNGVEYTAVQYNLLPDHIALLPDEIGACSVRDGCGAPRVNQAVTNKCGCTERSASGMLIEQILNHEGNSFTEEELSGFSDEALEKLRALLDVQNEEVSAEVEEAVEAEVIEEEAAIEEPVEEPVEEVETVADVFDARAAIDELRSLVDELRSTVQNMQDEQRAPAVANAAKALGVDESELKGLSEAALNAIVNKAGKQRGSADYAGAPTGEPRPAQRAPQYRTLAPKTPWFNGQKES